MKRPPLALKLNGGNNLDFHQKIFSGKMTLNTVAHSLAVLVHPGVPHLKISTLTVIVVVQIIQHSTFIKNTPFMAAKSLLISFSQILASRMLLLFVPTSANSFSIWGSQAWLLKVSSSEFIKPWQGSPGSVGQHRWSQYSQWSRPTIKACQNGTLSYMLQTHLIGCLNWTDSCICRFLFLNRAIYKSSPGLRDRQCPCELGLHCFVGLPCATDGCSTSALFWMTVDEQEINYKREGDLYKKLQLVAKVTCCSN